MPAILHLLDQTGWYALDTTSGQWLHEMDDPDAGFSAFHTYRDKIIPSAHPAPPSPSPWQRLRNWFTGR